MSSSSSSSSSSDESGASSADSDLGTRYQSARRARKRNAEEQAREATHAALETYDAAIQALQEHVAAIL
jgi:hypothetical protein